MSSLSIENRTNIAILYAKIIRVLEGTFLLRQRPRYAVVIRSLRWRPPLLSLKRRLKNYLRIHTTCDDSRFMYSPIEAALKVLNDIYSRKKLIGEAALALAHGGSARASGPTE